MVGTWLTPPFVKLDKTLQRHRHVKTSIIFCSLFNGIFQYLFDNIKLLLGCLSALNKQTNKQTNNNNNKNIDVFASKSLREEAAKEGIKAVDGNPFSCGKCTVVPFPSINVSTWNQSG